MGPVQTAVREGLAEPGRWGGVATRGLTDCPEMPACQGKQDGLEKRLGHILYCVYGVRAELCDT